MVQDICILRSATVLALFLIVVTEFLTQAVEERERDTCWPTVWKDRASGPSDYTASKQHCRLWTQGSDTSLRGLLHSLED